MGFEGSAPVLGSKYRLLRQIGEGGMGTVWEAEHVSVGRRVAVKLLRPDLTTDRAALGRFRREAQIAGRLGHDNVCEVLDAGDTEDGQHFLVLPLLKGESLSALIAREGPLSAERAVDIGLQILSGLEVAHRAGVIHRDLKPGNVFVTQVGDRADFVKLLDFGVSKVLDGGVVPVSTVTRAGAVTGTPHYMAPEQARGQADQDHRVDVYAVGVILYEMLTARRPFEGDNYNDLLIRIVTEPFKPPRAHRPDLPQWLEPIVLRALSRDRAGRFADASAMRAVLAREPGTAVVAPSDAAPATAGDKTVPEVLRAQPAALRRWKRAAAWLAAAIGIAAALLAASSGAGPRQAALPREHAANETSRQQPLAAEQRLAEQPLARTRGTGVGVRAGDPAVAGDPPATSATAPPSITPAPLKQSRRRTPGLVRGRAGAVVVTTNR